ncbi:hypothetical protein K7711_06625 [Nocardia sp. CA2R105]|uniref:Transmembrane protein n=1 Tax=Nocardia jiangxiensis TaxID=282685 RepID=A0ABW6SFE0_9NOCA|nr:MULTISPECIES: hypothetical protein [Nocardia]MBY8856144.1 hypothetical protein [Nocardia coffeae]
MSSAQAVITAVLFVWLGMVLAISFLEAPLKFRAPQVTLPIGLGIGRLVFRALNTVEVGFAAITVVALLFASFGGVAVAAVIAVVILAAQLLFVRPGLTRRSDAVLAGEDAPRSNAHFAYIALEVIKAIALLVGGILALLDAVA